MENSNVLMNRKYRYRSLRIVKLLKKLGDRDETEAIKKN